MTYRINYIAYFNMTKEAENVPMLKMLPGFDLPFETL